LNSVVHNKHYGVGPGFRRDDGLEIVIASEAKQSISRIEKYGLLRRFTPRNDEDD
jgi:hypothetical protein